MSEKLVSGTGASSSNRLSQYKNSGHDWKQAYRQRCLERLREKRAELLAKRRGVGAENSEENVEDSSALIKMVMTTELQVLKDQQDEEDIDFLDSGTGDIDASFSLLEEIQKELEAEEARWIAEYEIYRASYKKEEEALCYAIDMLYTQTHPVCPVCTKDILMENKGVIFCKCGIRINTEQDQISLEFVERQLEDARKQHSCDGQPQFSVTDRYGITNLLMTCQKCEFFYIVI